MFVGNWSPFWFNFTLTNFLPWHYSTISMFFHRLIPHHAHVNSLKIHFISILENNNWKLLEVRNVWNKNKKGQNCPQCSWQIRTFCIIRSELKIKTNFLPMLKHRNFWNLSLILTHSPALLFLFFITRVSLGCISPSSHEYETVGCVVGPNK